MCRWRGLCAEVGIQEVCRWWKAGHGVNGVESHTRLALDSLYVVVVNGDETLDRRWKCVSERLMSDRGVSKGVETVQVLVKNESVDVRSLRMPIRACGGWRVYTSAQNDWSAEMLVVADGVGCEVVGRGVG